MIGSLSGGGGIGERVDSALGISFRGGVGFVGGRVNTKECFFETSGEGSDELPRLEDDDDIVKIYHGT